MKSRLIQPQELPPMAHSLIVIPPFPAQKCHCTNLMFNNCLKFCDHCLIIFSAVSKAIGSSPKPPFLKFLIEIGFIMLIFQHYFLIILFRYLKAISMKNQV